MALHLTKWLYRSGHPELPVEKAAEITILSKIDPEPVNLLLRLVLVLQELTRTNINSLSLLDKTNEVSPEVMQTQSGLWEREVSRDDPGSDEIVII